MVSRTQRCTFVDFDCVGLKFCSHHPKHLDRLTRRKKEQQLVILRIRTNYGHDKFK